jgi:hypothetical protein
MRTTGAAPILLAVLAGCQAAPRKAPVADGPGPIQDALRKEPASDGSGPSEAAPGRETMDEGPGPFAIHASTAALPLYERDDAWRKFYQEGAFGKRLVGEEDIEAYDWDNQALILRPGAGSALAGAERFIAVLGERRLYGGRRLPRFSAMAIRYPVIYDEAVGGRTILFLRPSHDFGSATRLEDPSWAPIAATEVRQRFERLGKLRQPRVEPAFRALEESVTHARVLDSQATADALVLDYELSGTRAGACRVMEELSLRWGRRYGASFGPSREEVIELGGGTLRRRASYPYSALGKYGPSRREESLARLPDGTVPAPVWVLRVRVQPVLTEAETAVVGPVEAWRLQPDSWGGAALEDVATAELPVDWTKVP